MKTDGAYGFRIKRELTDGFLPFGHIISARIVNPRCQGGLVFIFLLRNL